MIIIKDLLVILASITLFGICVIVLQQLVISIIANHNKAKRELLTKKIVTSIMEDLINGEDE